MMRKLMMVLLALLPAGMFANDGVFYVNGNHLVPLVETDIAVAREVLTISLGDDGFARVDVQYEFFNRGKAKTVDMGFEAQAPYNDDAPLDKAGRHPHIRDFTATMNGERMECRNAVVAIGKEGASDFVALNLNRWKPSVDMDEGSSDRLYDASTQRYTQYAYAYYFTGAFRPGRNVVHHTYRYRMSSGVGRAFEVPYWLTPAMRWANRQIDDFTLRVKAEKTAKHFCLSESFFLTSPFVVTEGKGKVRRMKSQFGVSYIEVALRNGTVEWHAKDFRPACEMSVVSADAYIASDDRFPLGAFYDRSDTYVPSMDFERKPDARILRNLPYASRGYVFKDKALQTYFNRLWWYMPDPSWKVSTEDFTPREWRMIREGY